MNPRYVIRNNQWLSLFLVTAMYLGFIGYGGWEVIQKGGMNPVMLVSMLIMPFVMIMFMFSNKYRRFNLYEDYFEYKESKEGEEYRYDELGGISLKWKIERSISDRNRDYDESRRGGNHVLTIGSIRLSRGDDEGRSSDYEERERELFFIFSDNQNEEIFRVKAHFIGNKKSQGVFIRWMLNRNPNIMMDKRAAKLESKYKNVPFDELDCRNGLTDKYDAVRMLPFAVGVYVVPAVFSLLHLIG